MDQLIPLFSLFVAVLSVFIGPLISLRISKSQVLNSLEVANKQIIAPMRQAWINDLRGLISELTSSSMHYFSSGFENRRDEEYQRLTLLEYKIKFMLNAKEDDHKELEKLVFDMIYSLSKGKSGDDDFMRSHLAIVDLSRQILKNEWNRVKSPIKIA